MSALLWIERVPQQVRSEFDRKVRSISRRLGINPNWLMWQMNLESGFRPNVVNSIGATGLIQFMPATARGLGTTTQALAKMGHVEQLEWVYKYYKQSNKEINSAHDLALATFYPYAMGKPDSYILGEENSPRMVELIAKQNPIFDTNKDNKIHLGEYREYLNTRFRQLPEKFRVQFFKAAPVSLLTSPITTIEDRFGVESRPIAYIILGLVIATALYILYKLLDTRSKKLITQTLNREIK